MGLPGVIRASILARLLLVYGDNAIAEIDVRTGAETRPFGTGSPHARVGESAQRPHAGYGWHAGLGVEERAALGLIDVATGSTVKPLMLGAAPTGAGAA